MTWEDAIRVYDEITADARMRQRVLDILRPALPPEVTTRVRVHYVSEPEQLGTHEEFIEVWRRVAKAIPRRSLQADINRAYITLTGEAPPP